MKKGKDEIKISQSEGEEMIEEEIEEEEVERKRRRKRKPRIKKIEEKEEEIEIEEEKEEKIPKNFNKKEKKKLIGKSKRSKKKKGDEDEENTNSEASRDNDILLNEKQKKSKKIKNKYHQNNNVENYIMEAYKKISTANENINEEENDEESKNMIIDSNLKLCLKFCEKKLRKALKILKEDKNSVINRNILDKISRLIQHNQMNLNYVIGDIYMILMNKESAFDYDDKEFEINDLVLFINKVIQFRDILINTKIGIAYNNCLMKFLKKILNEFDLEEEQLEVVNNILNENKEKNHQNLLNDNFDDLEFSVSDELMKQENLYEQFKVIIQNKKLIIKMIKECDLEDRELYEKYLEFGKNLTYLFFNKSFRLYLSSDNKNNKDDEEMEDEEEDKNKYKDKDNVSDDIFGLTYLFFDGYKNNGEIKVINSENYYIESDDKIDELKYKICDVILSYSKKFIDLIDEFAIQYIIYILMKRMYFLNYEKYKKSVINILVEVLPNLCFFEDSPIGLISYFINKILKSTREEDEYFKNKLIKQINEVKDEEGFLYKFPKSLKHLEEVKDKEKNKKKKNKKKEDKNENKKKIIKEKEEKENKKEDKNKEEKNEEEKEKIKEDIKEDKREDKKDEQKDEQKEEEKNEEEKNEEEKEEEEDEEEEEEEEEDFDDEDEKGKIISRIDNEALLILEKDLKIGFFYTKNIKAGENFVFYEEINDSFAILDFCMTILQLDIKLKITDLTEGRIIYEKEGIDQLIHCPLKLVMFFSNPRILKFEFDNSYSWFTSKTVKYKVNIFYPKNPYLIGHQILISKYLNKIIKGRDIRKGKDKNKQKLKNKKKDKDKDENNEEINDFENLLISKLDGENKIFNCKNVKDNLEEINKMVKDKYLNISSIFIEIGDKKENEDNANHNFYYDTEDGLVKEELTKEKFEKYLSDLIYKQKATINLFNLYILNGDINENENENNKKNNKLYYHSMQKLLGFEPVVKIEGIMQKIIFFIQYLNQAQILYFLYKQICSHIHNDIIILFNFTKYCGYQFALYYDEEIFVDLNEFKGLNKNKSIEENIDIIEKGINKVKEESEDKKIVIVLTKSIDSSEINITPEKIEEKLSEKLKINENDKIKIIKTGFDFNKELKINSHVFYLDN